MANKKFTWKWKISVGLLLISLGIVMIIVDENFKLAGGLFILSGASFVLETLIKRNRKKKTFLKHR